MEKSYKTTNNKISYWKFILLMTIMVIVWGSAFPLIKIGLIELSFVNLTILRLFIVCIIFLLLLLFQSKRFTRLEKKDIIPIFILGFLGVIGYHLGLNYGEQYISAGAASLIIATIPVFILIFAFIFLKERLSKYKIPGIILALSGVIIISLLSRSNASIEIEYTVGAIGVLIAAILGAFYTIAGKKLLEKYSALSLTVYAILLGSLGLIPFVNLSTINEVINLSISGWLAIIILCIFSTVIGYFLWYWALERKSASEISVYLYAVPVVSTIISYFIFDDKITIYFIIGGLLVISGLYIVNKKIQKID
jgi:drug/metabolite transporter (DMT)-like permease